MNFDQMKPAKKQCSRKNIGILNSMLRPNYLKSRQIVYQTLKAYAMAGVFSKAKYKLNPHRCVKGQHSYYIHHSIQIELFNCEINS